MRRDKSLKEIAKMTAAERWNTAKEKLSSAKGHGAVSALLSHIRVHENTRWLNYRSDLIDKIPKSYAGHAFHSLQISNLHYEFIRICTFWDPVDLDSNSIPTIVALADDCGVSDCVYDFHFSQYGASEQALAEECGQTARRRLREGIRDAKELETSNILRSVRNLRDKLAHQLEQTREEKKGPVPVPKYGDERKLLDETIPVVNRLYLTLNGSDLDWKDTREMHRRNAEAFWKGVSVEVLR